MDDQYIYEQSIYLRMVYIYIYTSISHLYLTSLYIYIYIYNTRAGPPQNCGGMLVWRTVVGVL